VPLFAESIKCSGEGAATIAIWQKNKVFRLHKNHPAKTMVFCRGGNKNVASAYKTIDLYAHGPYCAV
jgi:hypothetical protein